MNWIIYDLDWFSTIYMTLYFRFASSFVLIFSLHEGSILQRAGSRESGNLSQRRIGNEDAEWLLDMLAMRDVFVDLKMVTVPIQSVCFLLFVVSFCSWRNVEEFLWRLLKKWFKLCKGATIEDVCYCKSHPWYVGCCLLFIQYNFHIDLLLYDACLFDFRSIFHPVTSPTTSSQNHIIIGNNNNYNNNNSNSNSNIEFTRPFLRRCQVRARPHGLCLVPMICRRCWEPTNHTGSVVRGEIKRIPPISFVYHTYLPADWQIWHEGGCMMHDL